MLYGRGMNPLWRKGWGIRKTEGEEKERVEWTKESTWQDRVEVVNSDPCGFKSYCRGLCFAVCRSGRLPEESGSEWVSKSQFFRHTCIHKRSDLCIQTTKNGNVTQKSINIKTWRISPHARMEIEGWNLQRERERERERERTSILTRPFFQVKTLNGTMSKGWSDFFQCFFNELSFKLTKPAFI